MNLTLIFSIEMRTFMKDDSKVKCFCVEVVGKDGRKFNFVIRDQM